MESGKFCSNVEEYIKKFGSADRFVQKIIDSLDCPFAIVDAKTCEIEVTNCKDFFPGMKCHDLFKKDEKFCLTEECLLKKVVSFKNSAIVKEFCSGGKSLEMHAHPIFDSVGEVVSVIIYGLDITQSQALAESEEKFRRFFESSPRGMLMYELVSDDRLVLIDSNPAVDDILGIDSKTLIGKTIEEAFPPLADTDIPDRFREVASKGRVCYKSEIPYDDGNVSGFYEFVAFQTSSGVVVTSFVDVSERKQAEEMLREREEVHVREVEERFYNILQNSQDLVYRYDFRNDGFDYVSESVFTILGYPLGEFMKMKRSDYKKMVHPEDLDIFEYTGDSSEVESVSDVEYRFKKKEGGYAWFKVKRVFFRDKEGALIYSIEDVKDISEKRLAEEEKVKLEERIAHMRSKSSETKERVSLTERERIVLWGFCRYPLLNDEELAKELGLKRSTLTAIKNRLRGKGWFSFNYIPNFHKLGCQFFSIFDVGSRCGKGDYLELIKKTSEVVFGNCQDDKWIGVFVSDKYVDFKKFLWDFVGADVFKHDFNEDSFFFDLDSVELYDVSRLVSSSFGLKKKPDAVVHRFEGGVMDLSTNEKRVLHEIIKSPEMSSSEIAKKIWTSKPTVIKVKKKLLAEGYVYPYVLPDFRKMGFSHIARLSFKFDSDLPKEVTSGSNDFRVILQVRGKNRVTKIMLFRDEAEYEEEVDLIKEFYRKKGFDFSLNSEIFPMQKRRSGDSKVESFVNDKLFGDEI